jgi:hypothetical protein
VWSVESRPWRGRRHVPPKCLLPFKGLHAVISQKTEFLITTAVKASNPTYVKEIFFPSIHLLQGIWDKLMTGKSLVF